MNDMPLVSVIIPAYNAEKTILETINSVLNQSHTNFELIVIDDGSTDRTFDLVKSVNDNRIKVYRFDNAGLPTARNRGLGKNKGEYVSFIDADDLWTDDKLEKQLAALRQQPSTAVAYSWTLLIDESGNFLHAMDPDYFEGNVYKKLLVRCFIASGSNALIRTRCLNSTGLFDPALESAADWDFWLRLSTKWDFVLVPRYQILYRIWSGSMSYDVKATEENILKTIDRAFSSAPNDLQPLKNKSKSAAYQYLTSLNLTRKTGQNWKKLALSNLKKSIMFYPYTLLSRHTQFHLWTIFLIYLLPSKHSSNFVNFLLKFKGRLMTILISELRTFRLNSSIRS